MAGRAQAPTLAKGRGRAAAFGCSADLGPEHEPGRGALRPAVARAKSATASALGVRSILNHFSDSFFTVPSLMAASIALVELLLQLGVALAQADADALAEDAADEARADHARSP